MALGSLEQLWTKKSGAGGHSCQRSHPTLQTQGLNLARSRAGAREGLHLEWGRQKKPGLAPRGPSLATSLLQRRGPIWASVSSALKWGW